MYYRFVQISLLIGLLSCSMAYATDIARDVRGGREDETIEQGGYFELSFSAGYDGLPVVSPKPTFLNISIGGHYRFKRFFIDAFAESYEIQFGLNAYSGSLWSVDVLAAASEQGIDSEFSDELKSFAERPGSLSAGIRATGYLGSYIVQFEALDDVSDTHDGHLLSAFIARQWLVRNWNFHALLGGRYQSANVVDYLFGVDADEVTERFAAYQAVAGTTYVTELGFSYPLNEYWIFRGTGRWYELPDSIANSPFITDDAYFLARATLTFVY